MSNPPETETVDVDNEIGAIKAILAALAPLTAPVRNNVLEYVLKRMGITGPAAPSYVPVGPSSELNDSAPNSTPTSSTASGTALHIREFKDQKRPRSANEMAAVVAYYLAHLAPKRKVTVNAKDLQDQFRIAEFPLPAQAKFTLVNARNAGYLNLAGAGEYELNAVGHNLVAHNLPRGEDKPQKSRPRKSAAKRRTKRK